MKIWVPGVVTARTPLANSLGLAVDRGMTVTVGDEALEWEVSSSTKGIANDQSNPIVEAALMADPTLVPHQLQVESQLPMGEGLSSSSAAMLAGFSLAAALNGEALELPRIAKLAAPYEPFPAAMAAALHGGFVQLNGTAVKKLQLHGVQGALYVPDHFTALPVPLSEPHEIESAGLEPLLRALATGDTIWLMQHFPIEPLAEMVTPTYFPHAEMVRRAVRQVGGFGVFPSGSGPALIAVAPKTQLNFLQTLTPLLTAGKVVPLEASEQGLTVTD
ncbi:GHMP family kinase ATP-binding protein [Lacticaseibacillus mingshuiensis]|uniref:GHMP kinase N-terminal domain-containing protein n=1 Tax=Lacticaseibacillus mingshuiensis TaxID=2799574 RepID=A0ABW4CHR7_9LACO|nr:hypothetical protein [Lacticaseibacillus mingshuiensis]